MNLTALLRRWRTLLPQRADYAEAPRSWRSDLMAGITVGIVALPLALAFGVSSGVGAEAGLITAVVAGIVAAVFGGSPVQVSGPTGAMVVVLAPIVVQFGVPAIVLVGVMAGVVLVVAALLRWGRAIAYIPWPVIEGFTVGIAVIIFLQQIPLVAGDAATDSTNAVVIAAASVWGIRDSVVVWNLVAVAVVALIMWVMPKISRAIPGSIVAIVVVTVAAEWAGVPLERIGELPSQLPLPALPAIDLSTFVALVPAALTVAALAGIESLLSARVATTMVDSGPYDPDRELFGQGLASIAAAAFGGMPATGAIARTAVNARSGARTRIAAIVHAVVLVLVIYGASSWAERIPLPALAGVLMVTAARMVPRGATRSILRSTKSDAFVFVATAVITVAFDLIDAVAIGIMVTAVFALRQLTRSSGVHREYIPGEAQPQDDQIAVFRLDGALFFGAAERIFERLVSVAGVRVVILRMSGLQFLDATGAHVLVDVVDRLHDHGVDVIVKGIQPEHHGLVSRVGLPGSVPLCASLDEALTVARALVAAR